MSLRLRCRDCGEGGLAALIYRGPGRHVCKRCGGGLALADARDERRSGRERRARGGRYRGRDWRSGIDRREAWPAG